MSDESPLDRFKTALTGAARAIAHDREAEIGWTADKPSQQGKMARIPMPGRDIPPQQAREARGFADSFALRMRHHNSALHTKMRPSDAAASACFDAIERARYEAIGESEYTGMRANMEVMQDRRLAGDPITSAESADDVPLHTALSLMLREQLTGQPIPQAAREGVEMVREFVESRIGDDFEQMSDALHDQSAFQKLGLDMLRHLDIVPMEPENDDGFDDDDESEEGEDEKEDDRQDEAPRARKARATTATRPPAMTNWPRAIPVKMARKCKSRSARMRRGRTFRTPLNTRPSPSLLTKSLKPPSCATRRNLIACAHISTASWQALPAW